MAAPKPACGRVASWYCWHQHAVRRACPYYYLSTQRFDEWLFNSTPHCMLASLSLFLLCVHHMPTPDAWIEGEYLWLQGVHRHTSAHTALLIQPHTHLRRRSKEARLHRLTTRPSRRGPAAAHEQGGAPAASAGLVLGVVMVDLFFKGRDSVFWWSVAAAGAATVAAVAYRATKGTYEAYVPLQASAPVPS